MERFGGLAGATFKGSSRKGAITTVTSFEGQETVFAACHMIVLQPDFPDFLRFVAPLEVCLHTLN